MATFSFRDDYSTGAHPTILQAIANPLTTLQDQAPYGDDDYTENAKNLIRQKMNGLDSSIHLVASGTLANLIAISSCLRPYEAVIAAKTGHIAMHETGAIEATGHKIITVDPVKGKLYPEGIQKALTENSLFPHMAKPRLVYISNATELGTVYTRAELSALSHVCRIHDLLLFLDGARLGVALTAYGNDLTFEDIGRMTDLFWIGGTKVGALLGEAIVINNESLKKDFQFNIKQKGGLLAKGRVLGQQFETLFREDLFFELARNANNTAKILSRGIEELGHTLSEDTETNQIFAIFPDSIVAKLHKKCSFYVWEKLEGDKSVVRLVTSWATDPGQVEEFLGLLAGYTTLD